MSGKKLFFLVFTLIYYCNINLLNARELKEDLELQEQKKWEEKLKKSEVKKKKYEEKIQKREAKIAKYQERLGSQEVETQTDEEEGLWKKIEKEVGKEKAEKGGQDLAQAIKKYLENEKETYLNKLRVK